MKLMSTVLALVGAIFVIGAAGYAAPAAAQATRTWISGVGDDANPCSRTAPCKTFAGAISKTAAGGEINCLDPGGFGAVTITKAITLNCTGTLGSILASGTNGINVSAGANDVVVIEGIEIYGFGTGLNGISFNTGAALIVRNTNIYGFGSGNANGIKFAPSAASELVVIDSIITNSGATSTGSGIEIVPTGSGSAKVTLRNVHSINNANNGVRLNTTNITSGTGIIATFENVEVSGNAQGLVIFSPNGFAATVMADGSSFSNNAGFGVLASGTGARGRIGNSVITGNNFGVLPTSSGVVNSYGNNQLDGNTSNNGAFSTPAATLQ